MKKPVAPRARFIVPLACAAVLIGGAIAVLSGCARSGDDNTLVSVGRGAPLAAPLPRPPVVTDPVQIIGFFNQVLKDARIVGPLVLPPMGPPGTPGETHRRRHSRERRGAARRQAVDGRSLYLRGLLRRPRAVERPALFPLQQPLWPRGAVGAATAGAIGDDPPRTAAVGLLRPRLSAQSDRQPVSVQDGAGALRGAARRRRASAAARPQHTYATVPGEWTGRYCARAGWRASNWYRMRYMPDVDHPVAADAGVSDAHGAGGLPRGQHERGAVAVAVLLARRLHAPLALGRDVTSSTIIVTP